jgi:protein-tyrosine phosphatase
MSLITPFLYLGNVNYANDYKFLTSKNINVIVNCARELPDFFKNDFKYIRLDLHDVPSQDITSSLKIASNLILENINNKIVSFVHCAAGISRSSSVVIYTIMRLHNWDFLKSFKFVKDMHPDTNPNSGFIEQLKNIGNNTIQPDFPTHFEQKETEEYLEPINRNRKNVYSRIF